jgi:hypothetical protein
MKKLALLIILVIISRGSVLAQSCLPGMNYFSNQAQIDSFPINYPGCTVIEGDVYIGGEDITNLDGFNVLTSIESNLSVGYYWGWGGNHISLETHYLLILMGLKI